MRLWFTPREGDPTDWHAEAQRSLARALAEAGHLPETRFAAASAAWAEVRHRDAVREARAALAIAPSFPDAIAFMGQLELEAGRPESGLARLTMAHDIEPTLRVAIFEPARWHGLYGDMDEFGRFLGLMRREVVEEPILGQYLVRVGAWRGDDAMIRDGVNVLRRQQHPIAAPLTAYGLSMLGEIEPFTVPAAFLQTASPRLRTIALQMQAEVHGKLGNADLAMTSVTQAADAALTDLEWMEKCPFLEPLRGRAEFADARKRVVARCQEIWAGS